MCIGIFRSLIAVIYLIFIIRNSGGIAGISWTLTIIIGFEIVFVADFAESVMLSVCACLAYRDLRAAKALLAALALDFEAP